MEGNETSVRETMKHGKETLQLLEAIHLPEEAAVIHCSAHQDI
jgi:hypothetical protein